MQKAGKTYAAAVADKSKQHNLGSPHAHVAIEFFEALAKDEAAPKILKDTAQQMATKETGDHPPGAGLLPGFHP